MTATLISAVICTFNRCTYLGTAIGSLAQQTLDRTQYEVVIVDNNSTDATREVVDNAIKQYPDMSIRYVEETTQGLSAARNRGALEAAGDYIAYLDDDARAAPCWLSALLTNFQKLQAACIGGRVYLDWEGDIPNWFPRQFLSLYTHLDQGPDLLLLNEQTTNRYLQGANIAFRRHLICDDGFAFPTNIGRKKHDLMSGEETEIVDRLLESGRPVYYLPEALVWHVVLPSRRSRRHLLRRLTANGATQPLIDMNKGSLSRSQLPRHLLFDLKNLLLCLARTATLGLLFQREKAANSFYEGLRYYGRVRTEVRLLREG